MVLSCEGKQRIAFVLAGKQLSMFNVAVCVLVASSVLQLCGGSHGVECIKSEMCKCQTDSNFTIDINYWGNYIL